MDFDSPSRRAFLAGSVTAVGGGAYYLTRGGDSDTAAPTERSDDRPPFHASTETTALGVDLTGNPIMGEPDAALDVYYWTDFQCPFCKQFEHRTLPDLLSEYVEAGRIRIVFVSQAYFGPDSMTAAVAGKCVWDQVRPESPSAYWPWHSTLFEQQGEKNAGWAAADELVDYTRSVSGVDAEALDACLDERRASFEAAIEADRQQARSLGVTGTPTFVVFDPETETGGKLVGAQPVERFAEAFERVDAA
jgi:protein-disulfide isomerase